MTEVNGKSDQEKIAEKEALERAEKEAAVYAGTFHLPVDLLRKIKGRADASAQLKAMIEQHLNWYHAQGITDEAGTDE